MNKERLLNVAKALRESCNAELDMSRFHRCGSPACALGHYAARRDLQSFMQFAVESSDGNLRFGVWGATTGANADHWLHIRKHFDITQEQADELFWVTGCGAAKTADKAAEYIEHFVAVAA